MATITDDTHSSNITITDATGASTSITDSTFVGGVIYDGVLDILNDSNINVFDLNSLPLNDVIPYDIISYGSGITDETGSATNITDD